MNWGRSGCRSRFAPADAPADALRATTRATIRPQRAVHHRERSRPASTACHPCGALDVDELRLPVQELLGARACRRPLRRRRTRRPPRAANASRSSRAAAAGGSRSWSTSTAESAAGHDGRAQRTSPASACRGATRNSCCASARNAVSIARRNALAIWLRCSIVLSGSTPAGANDLDHPDDVHAPPGRSCRTGPPTCRSRTRSRAPAVDRAVIARAAAGLDGDPGHAGARDAG